MINIDLTKPHRKRFERGYFRVNTSTAVVGKVALMRWQGGEGRS